jgi:PKD repeat protein
VCVSEFRRGVRINIHRKDIHIKVSDCIPLKANLKPDYSFCDDFNVVFRNEQVNPTGSVYTWDFGDGSAPQPSTIADGRLSHQYAKAGDYKVKLKVVLAGQCFDSTTTIARVWPGFFPGFDFDGACIFTPFRFQNTSRTNYPPFNYRKWEFGDETTDGDTSVTSDNPSWKYNSLGVKTVTLTVASEKGCVASITKQVEVKDKPDLLVPFTDTLICSRDSLQLIAIGDGVFTWTPADKITRGLTTGTPTVKLKNTTLFTVTMTENRCVASEKINVRVVDFVTLNAGADTTICTTDVISLNPISDGLRYNWSSFPQTTITQTTDKNPKTSPSDTTTYYVTANIGSCVANDSVRVRTVPYPIASAGADTTVCFEDTATLVGYTNGSSFKWEPLTAMRNSNTLSPQVFPKRSATYHLLAYDTLGCPKPGIDDVLVNVKDEIFADAGNDTAIVKDQPLQLKGSGAPLFEWSPEGGLSKTSIADPVAVLQEDATYIMRTFTEEGCFSLDTINVKVFQTLPDIFVPNAFIPGSINNELRPKPVGISNLDYFRVFNRWGQMVFQTSQIGRGWDGRINGVLQPNGTYVWMVKGKDYTGKMIQRKGTATLIR